MMRILMIALGGGLGAVLRYGVVVGMHRWGGGMFPWGTFTVNVIGSLLIGFLAAIFAAAWQINPDLELAIIVGLLGGFTTFSSFSLDLLRLSDSKQFLTAACYLFLSNAAAFSAAWLGSRLAVSIVK